MNTTIFKASPVDMEKRRKIDITPGNTVRVYLKIQEKGKTRLQVFEGLVISRKHGSEDGATFTVRKVASGVGMEKTFCLYSPVIDKVEIVKKSKVRRSKLYYIRDKAAKEVRRRMKQIAFSRVKEEEEDEKVEETKEAEVKTEEADVKTEENQSAVEENTQTKESSETEIKEKSKEEENTEVVDEKTEEPKKEDK